MRPPLPFSAGEGERDLGCVGERDGYIRERDGHKTKRKDGRMKEGTEGECGREKGGKVERGFREGRNTWFLLVGKDICFFFIYVFVCACSANTHALPLTQCSNINWAHFEYHFLIQMLAKVKIPEDYPFKPDYPS